MAIHPDFPYSILEPDIRWFLADEALKKSSYEKLLQLDKSGIKVAEYMTELPKHELLEQKLHKAVELARKRLEAKPA